MVIEPLVQGASGMLCASASDVRRLGEACRQAGTLLICDEVATGFGRTGTLFASEQCGVRPDLMCVGKGITGGYLAMSATVASGEVFGAFLGADLGPETFYHGHSYGGNALAAAVALEHLRLIEAWDVLANVRARAEQLSSLLAERVAGSRRGARDPSARTDGRRRAGAARRRGCAGVAGCAPGAVARGVLLRPLGDVVVLMPPLTITADEIVRIVDALDGGLDDLSAGARPACRRSATRRHMTDTPSPWDDADPGRPGPGRRRGSLACPPGVRRPRTGGPARGWAGRVVRVQRLSRIERPPGRGGGRPDALARWGAGSGASRLVTGSRPVHSELEQALAEWKGTEAAVCFPTGFAANLGVLCALGGPGVRILSDELNHASIIDGCRLSRSALAVYRHRDMGHLDELLADCAAPTPPPAPAHPTIVVTDSVFSMDGDVAPLDELVTLCRRHDALLILDEAHAVLGPDLPSATGRDGGGGMGDRDRDGMHGGTVVRVGTLSKTLGSLGGFVAASRDVVDLIVNRARSYIFSTAPTPADAAAALAALRVLRSAEGAALTGRLAALIDRVARGRVRTAGTSEPDHPGRPRQRAGGAECVGGAARTRACGSRPSARPRCRSAPAVCGSPCRLHTATRMSAGCYTRWRGWPPTGPTPTPRPRPLTGVRPRRVVAVVGTGTDVGKTWVAARLLSDLRAAGLRVAARKPAQSFDPDDDPAGLDAAVLGAATRRAPRGGLPAAPLVRGGDGAPDGGRGPGPPALHHSTTSCRNCAGPRRRRRRAGRDGGRRALALGGRR